MRKILMFPINLYNNNFIIWLALAIALVITFIILRKKTEKRAEWLLIKLGVIHGASKEDILFITKSINTLFSCLAISLFAGIIAKITPANRNLLENFIVIIVFITYAVYLVKLFIWVYKLVQFVYKSINSYTPFGIRKNNINTATEDIKRQKIFFCAAPEDYEKYLPTMSEDIFRTHPNVDIIYLNHPEYPTNNIDKSLLVLGILKVQLIMFPVTKNLLQTDNLVINQIIPLALKEKIPLLPLAIEPGLEKIFNEKCGDIQLISKYTENIAVYEDKLEKFLSSILLDERLIQQIRQAFDAYIFLSYRRRDKKYAEEIMHLIHENEFCRDIAIWYDEFLIPGDHFNEAILNACQNSHLFALVVTPSLLEKPNYVMDIEYPFARDQKKRILPIIARTTKIKSLSKYYKDIPTPIEIGASLNDALRKFSAELKSPEDHEDPRHLFFIALAYLSGIDVEKNPERAIKLLEKSARSGFPDAYRKLVSIYRTGNGFPINLSLAAHWQEEFCSFLDTKGFTEQEYKITCRLELYTLSDIYWSIRDLHGLDRTIARISSIDQEFTNSNSFEDLNIPQIFDICYSCNMQGKIMLERNQVLAAIEQLDKAISIGEKLLQAESFFVKQYYPFLIEERAHYDVINGDSQAAYEKYQKSLAIRQKMLGKMDYYEFIGLAYSYYGLCLSMCTLSQPNEATIYLQLGLECVEKAGLHPDFPTSSLHIKAAFAALAGDIAIQKEDINTALEQYTYSREAYYEIYKELSLYDARQSFILATCKLAILDVPHMLDEARELISQFESDYPDHFLLETYKSMLEGC